VSVLVRVCLAPRLNGVQVICEQCSGIAGRPGGVVPPVPCARIGGAGTDIFDIGPHFVLDTFFSHP
jgi:hypothetical protein